MSLAAFNAVLRLADRWQVRNHAKSCDDKLWQYGSCFYIYTQWIFPFCHNRRVIYYKLYLIAVHLQTKPLRIESYTVCHLVLVKFNISNKSKESISKILAWSFAAAYVLLCTYTGSYNLINPSGFRDTYE